MLPALGQLFDNLPALLPQTVACYGHAYCYVTEKWPQQLQVLRSICQKKSRGL